MPFVYTYIVIYLANCKAAIANNLATPFPSMLAGTTVVYRSISSLKLEINRNIDNYNLYR